MTVLQSVESVQSQRLWKWGLRIGSVLAVFSIWEIIGRALNSLLMPTFFETVVALGQLIGTRELWEAVWISNQAMLVGFISAMLVSVPIGLLLGRSRKIEKVGNIWVDILLVTPKSALIPLFIIAFGLGLVSRALFVFLRCSVYMVINTRAGLRNVDPDLIEMARSFGATEAQLWRDVLLPGTLPGLVVGVRVSLARAVSAMVTVELLMIALGIGRLIMGFQSTFQAGSLYAVIFVVLAEAFLVVEVAKWFTQRIGTWDSGVADA